MALDGIYLYSLINELKDFAINSKIDKVNQPEKDEIILTLRGKGTKKLLISSSSNYPRLHFTTINKINPLKAPVFCMVLRKYLIGGKIIDITQYSTDRIISIDIENKDELGFDSKYSLIVEIMARHSNITLVRKRDNKIMESIKHIHSNKNSYRVLYPGATFIMPPTSNKLNPFSFTKEELKNLLKENINFNESIFSKIITGVGKNLSNDLFIEYKNKFNDLTIDNLSLFITDYFKNILKDNKNILFFKDGKVVDFYFKDLISLNNCEKKYFESHSDTLDNFYATKDKQDRLHSKGLDIQRLINTNIERCLKKIKILEKTLKECEAKEDYRIKGELLTSYIYGFKKGDKDVSVLNYYSENEEYLKISLDENKTPSENIQFYFKKYNKLKNAEEASINQLSINEDELNYLNSVLTSLETADNYADIEEIKKELIETGYVRFRKEKNKNKIKTNKPLHFISSDGIDIYVGKNNIQNDYLTLKFAEKTDTWLHTKIIPGSHVIIKGKNIPESTLLEAATLAAFYSKGKNSTKVPVDYTLVKNVKKPSGAKPGMVIYSTNKTLYIDPPKNINLTKEN
ncbi:Rqc2 family fibronectin-binding protein [Sarcina ventriculi]|uniref:Rqc2 homolog RqcH n=1 Tax=Sarcina ventriculi TaxID=1267 RepID=A0ABP2AME5_SARVE|nr:NFACT RNA binding domain-containing protein [Sarcina ventriculi]MBU5321612.1 NFACT family protein [Sarcina ventriculi]CUN51711.1 Fibronectin-binding protein A N-terminus (FbpA) [Sarcina ventriculi]